MSVGWSSLSAIVQCVCGEHDWEKVKKTVNDDCHTHKEGVSKVVFDKKRYSA